MIKRDGGKTGNYSRRKAIKASGRFRSGQMVDQKYPLDTAIRVSHAKAKQTAGGSI